MVTELAVVVAIIAVLFALVLPLVQLVRAAAALRQCQDNLKQVMQAVHQYQGRWHQLPPGYLSCRIQDNTPGSNWSKQLEGQQVGVLAFLLPYLGQEEPYRQIVDPAAPAGAGNATMFDLHLRGYRDDRDAPAPGPKGYNPEGSNWWKSGTNYAVACTTIRTFLCPANLTDANALSVGTCVSMLFQINGNQTVQRYYLAAPFDRAGGYPSPSLTNYVGVCGARGNNVFFHDTSSWTANLPPPVTQSGWVIFAGVFDNRTTVSLAQIPDGTSFTLAEGEGTGDMGPSAGAPSGTTTLGWSWMGVGAMGTWRGLGGPDSSSWAQFASRHASVINVAYCDGAVHTKSRNVDETPWLTARPNPPPWRAPESWWGLQMLAGYEDGMMTQ
jgi:type II secretory pathway pseudopilin PulG